MQPMMSRLRCRSRRVTLAAMLSMVAVPALAQPIEAGSQDVFARPGGDDPGRDQARARREGRRGAYPVGQEPGAGSPGRPAAWPQPRRRGDPAPYGGYGANGDEAGAGDETMTRSGVEGGTHGEDRWAPVAPGGGPGGRMPTPLGAGSLYGGSAFNGTAAGPQYSDQLPAIRDRFRR